MQNEKYQIDVKVVVHYLAVESDPAQHRHIFAYTITLTNLGSVAAKLLTRHWYVMNAYGDVHEVQGEGVVGEQPHLKPGESYQYTSFAVIETALGTMHGSYQMLADDGHHFEAPIAMFRLAAGIVLH